MMLEGLAKQGRFRERILRRGQVITFTRPANIGGTATTFFVTAIVEPLSVKSAAMLQLEGLINVGEAVPYLLDLPGDSDVREGDLCTLDALTWEVLQVTAARDQGVLVVKYAVVTRLAVNVMALTPPTPTPSPIPQTGLVGWFKADGTVWKDAGATVLATLTGDPVGAWKDYSPAASNLVQATNVNRPSLTLSGQNALPVITFSADAPGFVTSGYLTSPTLFNVFDGDVTTHPFSVFAVFQESVNPPYPDAVERALFSAGTTSTSAQMQNYTDFQGNYYYNARNDSIVTDKYFGGFASDTVVHTLVITRDASGLITIRIDGVPDTGGTIAGDFPSTLFFLGASTRPGDTTFWDGFIAEFGVYNRALTSGEVTTVETYLRSKWGLTRRSNRNG